MGEGEGEGEAGRLLYFLNISLRSGICHSSQIKHYTVKTENIWITSKHLKGRKKHDLCNSTKQRKRHFSETFAHKQVFFRENIALTYLIPFIHNNFVFLFLLICRF